MCLCLDVTMYHGTVMVARQAWRVHLEGLLCMHRACNDVLVHVLLWRLAIEAGHSSVVVSLFPVF